GQNEAALTVLVLGLADEASGNLANKLLFRSNDACVRSAIAEWNSERLRLHGENVGFDRRANDTERKCLGDRYDKEGALFVRDLCDRSHVLDGSEEIGRLNQDAGSLVVESGVESLEVHAAVVCEINLGQRHALMLRVR